VKRLEGLNVCYNREILSVSCSQYNFIFFCFQFSYCALCDVCEKCKNASTEIRYKSYTERQMEGKKEFISKGNHGNDCEHIGLRNSGDDIPPGAQS
jgi:hypothetical protein